MTMGDVLKEKQLAIRQTHTTFFSPDLFEMQPGRFRKHRNEGTLFLRLGSTAVICGDATL